MFLCTVRFDMQEEQLAFLKEFFLRDEIEAANKEREDSPTQFDIDPISDNEEEDTQEQDKDVEQTEQPVASDDEAIPLRTQEEGNTQIRVSVRARKRLRREDDQNPKVYPQPDAFVPQRWFDPTELMKLNFLPFSAGPRACVGLKCVIHFPFLK